MATEEVGTMRHPHRERLPILDEVLRGQARHRRSWRAVRIALILLAVSGVLWLGPPIRTVPLVPGTGAVTGYIQPCSGLGTPEHTSTGAVLFSAAAIVEALPGHEHWKPLGGGNYQQVLPTVVAARDRVSQNQQFWLGDLAPGRYVILARYTPGDMSTFLDVSVAPGQMVKVDLPNRCI
jgi:hypothetical protein